jgi:hypothetical protein
MTSKMRFEILDIQNHVKENGLHQMPDGIVATITGKLL